MFSFVKRYLLLFDSQRQFEQQHSRPQVWRLAAFLLFTMSCCIDSAAGEDPAAPKDKALPAAGTKGAEHYAPGTVLRELPKPSATGPISPSKWNLADLRPRVEERLSSITSLHVRYKVWLKGHEQDFESWEWAFQGKQRLIRSDLTSLEAASPRRLWYSFDGTRGFRVNDFDQEYSLEPGVDVFDEPPPRIDFVDEMRTVIGLEVPYSDFTVAEIMSRSDIRKHGLFLHPWAVKPEDVGKTKAADLAEKSDYMFELGPFGEGGRKTNVLQLAVDPRHGCCPSMLRVVSVRLNDAIQSHALDKSKPFEARDGEYSLLTHVERFTEVLDSVSGKKCWLPELVRGSPWRDRMFQIEYVSVNRPLETALFVPPMPFGTKVRMMSRRDPKTQAIPEELIGGAAAEAARAAKVSETSQKKASAELLRRSTIAPAVAVQPVGRFWMWVLLFGLVMIVAVAFVWWRSRE